jgi:hypothetical protein
LATSFFISSWFWFACFDSSTLGSYHTGNQWNRCF